MADGDRVHRAPNQRHDEWHVTVARALGRATRMTALEIEMLGRTMMRVKDSFLPDLGPRRRPLPLLLKKLGEVVSRHADRDYVTLRSDPVFWALIRQIHASQPVARPVRAKRRAPKRLAKHAARPAKAEPRGPDEAGGESAVDASESGGLDDVADMLGLVGAEIAAVESGDASASEGDDEPTDASASEDESADASASEDESADPAAGEGAEESASSDASVDEEDKKEQPE